MVIVPPVAEQEDAVVPAFRVSDCPPGSAAPLVVTVTVPVFMQAGVAEIEVSVGASFLTMAPAPTEVQPAEPPESSAM